MSMPFLVFTCTDCDYQGSSTVGWGEFAYEGGGRRVPVQHVLAWCTSCNDIAPVEELPDGKRIERLASEIVSKEQELGRMMRMNVQKERSLLGRLLRLPQRPPREMDELECRIFLLQEELQHERDRLELLAGRRCGPRCLICGSLDHVPLPEIRLEDACEDAPESPRPAVPVGVRHPGCSGNLLVALPPVRISIAEEQRLYDSSGKRI